MLSFWIRIRAALSGFLVARGLSDRQQRLAPGCKVQELKLGLSLSLSGRYAEMGRQALAALNLFIADQNAGGGVALGGQRRLLKLECHDDQGVPERCIAIYRALCFEQPVDILLGPYASDLVRVAAPVAEQAGMVLVNHAGAGDDLVESGWRFIVSVPSPASDYLRSFATMLATLKFWRKRVALVSAPTPFARAVIDGLHAACIEPAARRRGVRICLKRITAERDAKTLTEILHQIRRGRINVLVSAGSFTQDVALMKAAAASPLNLPVLACVAAGISRFGHEMGDMAEGVVGPSQWEPEAIEDVELGPTPQEFVSHMRRFAPDINCDYPAAQAYAAGLLAIAALINAGTLDQGQLRQVFSALRTRTLYGDFAIAPDTGRQVGHKTLLVQWHQGKKITIDPAAHMIPDALELPSGWRLLLASLRSLRPPTSRK
jgi:branched-chain amino acid transport system substrate-binding protein